jgi:hypothetical protein
MSTLHYATYDTIQFQHDLADQTTQPVAHQRSDRATMAIVTAAVAIFPAAFWALLAWLVWGRLAAGIVTIVVLVVSILTMGLLRSAGEVGSRDAAPSHRELSHAA